MDCACRGTAMAEVGYNATVIARQDITPELAILRIRPDEPNFAFAPGQFAMIGLAHFSPRIDPDESDASHGPPEKLIRRAYSIASSSREKRYVELYLNLVHCGALTSRLWMLKPGDRLWLSP